MTHKARARLAGNERRVEQRLVGRDIHRSAPFRDELALVVVRASLALHAFQQVPGRATANARTGLLPKREQVGRGQERRRAVVLSDLTLWAADVVFPFH